jgi:hypothetical protein
MKYKVILLLAIIIDASPYICRHLPFNEFTICEPGRFRPTKVANLKEKKPKQKETEFSLHLIKENEPGKKFDKPGQNFVINYLGPLDRPYADEWQIALKESNLEKTARINTKDIFGVTAARLFFDRIVKLKMLYNNIVGVKNIQYKQPKFFSEHFEALRLLEGFIKETTTSGSQLKSLTVVLSVMINLEESLRPAGNNCELRILDFLINLTAFKHINGVTSLNSMVRIIDKGRFGDINKLLIECEYSHDCILGQCNAKKVNHKTQILCDMDYNLFSFITQMKTWEEFTATVSIIKRNEVVLLSNNLLSNPEIYKMRIGLEDAKKIVYCFGTLDYWDEMLLSLRNIFENDFLTILKSMYTPASREMSEYDYLMEFETRYQILKKDFVEPYLVEQVIADS